MTTNLEKWLTTLETTDLTQGKEMLHYTEVEDGLKVEKFCCLGIGCALAGIEVSDFGGGVFSYDGGDSLAPASFVRWLGIPVIGDLDKSNQWDIGVYTSDDERMRGGDGADVTAANMNDSGLTFAQIAQVLRTHTIKAI